MKQVIIGDRPNLIYLEEISAYAGLHYHVTNDMACIKKVIISNIFLYRNFFLCHTCTVDS